jgi:hypothetical protein
MKFRAVKLIFIIVPVTVVVMLLILFLTPHSREDVYVKRLPDIPRSVSTDTTPRQEAEVAKPRKHIFTHRRLGPIIALQDMPDGPGEPIFYANNADDVRDAVSYGFRAVKVWPRVPIYSSDFEAVMRNPAIDVVVIRPLQGAVWEPDEGIRYTWEVQDFGKIAKQLYLLYGYENKVVIISNCEADWQVGDCQFRIEYVPTQQEQDAFLALLNSRQASISKVRGQNLGKPLQVYHNVEISRVLGKWPFEVLRDIIPKMQLSPDYISLSSWMAVNDGQCSITDALNYIKLKSGLANDKIFIGEMGYNDSRGLDYQYRMMYDNMDEALRWGVRFGFYWMWVSRWDDTPGMSMLFQGKPTPTLKAAQDLTHKWEQ